MEKMKKDRFVHERTYASGDFGFIKAGKWQQIQPCNQERLKTDRTLNEDELASMTFCFTNQLKVEARKWWILNGAITPNFTTFSRRDETLSSTLSGLWTWTSSCGLFLNGLSIQMGFFPNFGPKYIGDSLSYQVKFNTSTPTKTVEISNFIKYRCWWIYFRKNKLYCKFFF